MLFTNIVVLGIFYESFTWLHHLPHSFFQVKLYHGHWDRHFFSDEQVSNAWLKQENLKQQYAQGQIKHARGQTKQNKISS